MDISACLYIRHLKLPMCQTKCLTLMPYSRQQLHYSGSSHQWSNPLIWQFTTNSLEKSRCLYLQSISPDDFSTATNPSPSLSPFTWIIASVLTDHWTSYSSCLSQFSTQYITHLFETFNISLCLTKSKPRYRPPWTMLLSSPATPLYTLLCHTDHLPVTWDHQIWPASRILCYPVCMKYSYPRHWPGLLPYVLQVCSNITFSVRSILPFQFKVTHI